MQDNGCVVIVALAQDGSCVIQTYLPETGDIERSVLPVKEISVSVIDAHKHQLITGHQNGHVRIWDIKTQQLCKSYAVDEAPIISLGHDAIRFYIATADKFCVFDKETSQEVMQFDGGVDDMKNLCIHDSKNIYQHVAVMWKQGKAKIIPLGIEKVVRNSDVGLLCAGLWLYQQQHKKPLSLRSRNNDELKKIYESLEEPLKKILVRAQFLTI